MFTQSEAFRPKVPQRDLLGAGTVPGWVGFGPTPRGRGLLAGPAGAPCLGWIRVGGNYTDAGTHLNLTADDTGQVWRIMPPASNDIRGSLGPADRVVIHAYVFNGNELWNVQGWGREQIFRIQTVGPDPARCPEGTAAPSAPPAPPPAPLPPPPATGPDQWAASPTGPSTPAPGALPVEPVTAYAPPAPSGTPAAAGEVPTYGPIPSRREELEGKDDGEPAATTEPGPALNAGVVLAGAALVAVLIMRDRRR